MRRRWAALSRRARPPSTSGRRRARRARRPGPGRGDDLGRGAAGRGGPFPPGRRGGRGGLDRRGHARPRGDRAGEAGAQAGRPARAQRPGGAARRDEHGAGDPRGRGPRRERRGAGSGGRRRRDGRCRRGRRRRAGRGRLRVVRALVEPVVARRGRGRHRCGDRCREGLDGPEVRYVRAEERSDEVGRSGVQAEPGAQVERRAGQDRSATRAVALARDPARRQGLGRVADGRQPRIALHADGRGPDDLLAALGAPGDQPGQRLAAVADRRPIRVGVPLEADPRLVGGDLDDVARTGRDERVVAHADVPRAIDTDGVRRRPVRPRPAHDRVVVHVDAAGPAADQDATEVLAPVAVGDVEAHDVAAPGRRAGVLVEQVPGAGVAVREVALQDRAGDAAVEVEAAAVDRRGVVRVALVVLDRHGVAVVRPDPDRPAAGEVVQPAVVVGDRSLDDRTLHPTEHDAAAGVAAATGDAGVRVRRDAVQEQVAVRVARRGRGAAVRQDARLGVAVGGHVGDPDVAEAAAGRVRRPGADAHPGRSEPADVDPRDAQVLEVDVAREVAEGQDAVLAAARGVPRPDDLEVAHVDAARVVDRHTRAGPGLDPRPARAVRGDDDRPVGRAGVLGFEHERSGEGRPAAQEDPVARGEVGGGGAGQRAPGALRARAGRGVVAGDRVDVEVGGARDGRRAEEREGGEEGHGGATHPPWVGRRSPRPAARWTTVQARGPPTGRA